MSVKAVAAAAAVVAAVAPVPSSGVATSWSGCCDQCKTRVRDCLCVPPILTQCETSIREAQPIRYCLITGAKYTA